MPICYLLALSAGSSLDQQSNNITLFSLVEQVNIPPGATPAPGTRIPLEIHAYLKLDGHELGAEFEMRFVLVGAGGLETYSDPATHRSATTRLRTRALGVPFPPSVGHYDLQVEFRMKTSETFERDPARWPISFVEAPNRPPVTH